MSAEAIVLLRQALHAADDQPARQRAAIDRLHEIQRQNRLPRRARPAQQVVREDRDASR